MFMKVDLYNVVPKKCFYVTVHDAVIASLKFMAHHKKESVSPEFHNVLDQVIETLAEAGEPRLSRFSSDSDKETDTSPIDEQPTFTENEFSPKHIAGKHI